MSSLRILLFGDSLTAGYHSWGSEYHPYSTRLKQRLDEKFPSKEVAVTVNGLPGDTVIHGNFESRLISQLNREQYDWVVLIGGTNDLGWGRDTDVIFEALEMLWDKAVQSGAKVLASTVPANQGCNSAMGRMRLEDLNEMILSSQQDSLSTLDLYSLIPWPGDDLEAQQRIWDDGLHFTPEGYDIMGDAIASKLISLIE